MSSYLPVTDYLLHRPPMLLVDKVLSIEGARVECSTHIESDSPFCDGQSVPPWVGIEYMAQTVGVIAGHQSLLEGKPVEIGFLVGCRNYKNYVPHYSVGETLVISATESLAGDNKIFAMECQIKVEDKIAAEAVLLVYKPDDLDAYLNSL
jgi:predicted hotdog family 3-hydroxylacyl-ACP dehydratase